MPNCFSLTRKSNPADGPVKFAQIDDEMCAAFGIAPHPNDYYGHWYDVIGLGLAMGRTFAELRERYTAGEDEYDKLLVKIVNYLDEHFTSDAWYQHK